MPYKRKYKKRGRRRKSKLTLTAAPVPKSKMVKMRYGFFGTLNPGAGTTATWVVRANSIFDPDASGAGHQPYGHDQWQTFYNHYVVLGSKITVDAISTDATAKTGQAIASVSLQDDLTTSPSQTLSLLERPGCSYKPVGSSNASRGTRLTNTFSAKKFFGVANVNDNIDRLGAQFGANPAEGATFHITVGSIDASTDPSAVAITVVVDYICLLTERTELVES